jgi:hypothetical protein
MKEIDKQSDTQQLPKHGQQRGGMEDAEENIGTLPDGDSSAGHDHRPGGRSFVDCPLGHAFRM